MPLIGKKLQSGMISLENRDKKWSDIFSNSMFIGMIAAFLGYVFCDVSGVFAGEMAGLIPVLVMLMSAVVMILCGLLITPLTPVLFITIPALNAGRVGIMVPVSVLFTLAVSRILYKKNLL